MTVTVMSSFKSCWVLYTQIGPPVPKGDVVNSRACGRLRVDIPALASRLAKSHLTTMADETIDLGENKLSEFIGRERDQYEDLNMFAFALGQVDRYYRFLHIIHERYAELSARFVENTKRHMALSKELGSGPVGPEMWKLQVESRELGQRLHLEIESFFLFGAIFLDRAASFFVTYYGGPKKRKGVTMRYVLNEQLVDFADERGMVLPDGLTDVMTLLEDELAKYRNKQITHDDNPRSMYATTFDANGNTAIAKPKLYPREGDEHVESAKLPDLIEAIEKYTDLFILLIETNRAESELRLKAGA
jgi:hypothetical protein